MSSPVEAVFPTAELLEAILHKLSTKHLLFAQAVSKQWKATIEGSPKLQRALFFKAADIELLTLKGYPHLLKCRWSTAQDVVYPVYENPLLQDEIYDLRFSSVRPHRLPPGGSWSRMLLTQPALDLVWCPW